MYEHIEFFRKDPANTPQRCIWGPFCDSPASDRYPFPFCQEHLLLMWSYVDEDIRATQKTSEERDQEQEQVFIEAQERHDDAIKDNMSPPKPRHVNELQPPGLIYYLQVGDYIKVGYTSNAKRRGSEYPPGSKLLLSYPGSREDEKRLHEKFVAYREAGREWYMDAAEIREHIEEMKAQHGRFEAGLQRRARHDPTPVSPRPRTSRGIARRV